MLITIYDSTDNPKCELSPNDSSTQVKEVQGDNVLSLSFTHYEFIEIDVDDYVDFLGERYWVTEKYRPKQNSTMEWEYNLRLYGVESMIRRILVIKTVDNEEEPVFTLTAPPREHVAMIVRCMNKGMGNVSDWKVGRVEGTENIVIDYFGKYCDEALKEIAEKVSTEWWVEGQTVNICKCEHGEPVFLAYEKGLLSIDPDTADNVKFYTRLYPVGSDRNIDREKYGFTRLQLPGGLKYVEVNADKYGRVDHFEQEAFAGIYPRRIGQVSRVRSEEKTGEDGKPFTIYYFSDNSLPFDPNDYEIGGLVKRVSFQEGSELAGLGDEEDGTYYFEVNFDSKTREFEIITIWPYDNDIQLPGDKLVPKVGDKYILWNLRMPDEYYTLAEQEFLTAVNKYNADHNLDISVFKALTDHVWIEDNKVELTIGRRVRLESEEYFPEFGYRDSRITKITRKVNLPSSMDIEIGDALSRTSMQKISDTISNVRSFAEGIGRETNLPDIIRTWDKTPPTDNNLFSARRSQYEFLSRVKADNAQRLITFDDGAQFGEFDADMWTGRGGMIDKHGNAVLESLRLRSSLEVAELIVNRISALEGDQLLTESDIIETVTPLDDGTYDLTLRERWDGYFTAQAEGNVLKGIINTLGHNSDGTGIYQTSWMLVNSVTQPLTVNVKVYPDSEVPAGHNYAPQPGMRVARWGNDRDPLRQSCIYLSATEGRIMRKIGVTKPITDMHNDAFSLGTLPEWIDSLRQQGKLPVKQGADYVYVRGIIAQDFIQMDHQGNYIDPTGKDGASYTANLLVNSDFGKGLDAWSGFWEHGDVSAYRVLDGRLSARLSPATSTGLAPGTCAGFAQSVDFSDEGAALTFSFNILATDIDLWDAAGHGVYAQIQFLGDNDAVLDDVTLDMSPDFIDAVGTDAGDKWRSYIMHGTTPPGVLRVRVWVYQWDNGQFYLNGPKLERGRNTNPVWTPNSEDLRGADGKDGQDGKDGKDGANGKDGDKGERGFTIRGPRKWESIEVGETLYSGAEGETFLDIVEYNGGFFSVVKTHWKTAADNPTDNPYGHFSGASKYDLVATDVLFAQRAKINNLYAEEVDAQKDGKRIHIDPENQRMTIYDSYDPAKPADAHVSAVFDGNPLSVAEIPQPAVSTGTVQTASGQSTDTEVSGNKILFDSGLSAVMANGGVVTVNLPERTIWVESPAAVKSNDAGHDTLQEASATLSAQLVDGSGKVLATLSRSASVTAPPTVGLRDEYANVREAATLSAAVPEGGQWRLVISASWKLGGNGLTGAGAASTRGGSFQIYGKKSESIFNIGISAVSSVWLNRYGSTGQILAQNTANFFALYFDGGTLQHREVIDGCPSFGRLIYHAMIAVTGGTTARLLAVRSIIGGELTLTSCEKIDNTTSALTFSCPDKWSTAGIIPENIDISGAGIVNIDVSGLYNANKTFKVYVCNDLDGCSYLNVKHFD